jgi:hypothetical protein
MPSNFTPFYLYHRSASDYGDNADASENLAASLKAISICWERSNVSSYFVAFYLYHQSASDYGDNANASENLALSLKAISGAPLPDIEAKKMMAAKTIHLNTPDGSLYML